MHFLAHDIGGLTAVAADIIYAVLAVYCSSGLYELVEAVGVGRFGASVFVENALELIVRHLNPCPKVPR